MTQYAISNGKVHRGTARRKDGSKRDATAAAASSDAVRPKKRSREQETEKVVARDKGTRLRGGDGENARRKKRRKSAAASAAAAAAVSAGSAGPTSRSRHRRSSGDKEKRASAAAASDSGPSNSRRCSPCFWIVLITFILLLIILVPVGVLVVGKKNKNTASDSSTSSKGGENGDLSDVNESSIPSEVKGTYMDPFTWLDTTDFNVTYTGKTVGDLPIIGLFDDYDDSTQANNNVPPLNAAFDYGKTPIRGINIGGWLILEPFITPSFFSKYDEKLGIVDEWTLSKYLGPSQAAKTMEQHYSTFVTEDTFKGIADAGLDHVRMPYGYWCVTTMSGDAFVPNICWRYLLRGIEWARKYGLRVDLDLHSVPGGENGWNHSGRQGVIGWLNGTNGEANAQKTLEIHSQLATFFAQPRYKNIITLYGLVNEPKMTFLDPDKVVAWTEDAYHTVRNAGYEGKIIFGDGFRGLDKWKGEFTGLDGMLLDVHQYVIFNTQQIGLSHTDKVKFACNTWTAQMEQSMDTSTGFGPTVVGEWGQADTDCTQYLNNVNVGSRWEGDMQFDDPSQSVLSPCCNGGKDCSCAQANADPSTYSDVYKQFLLMFAEAQMDAFEAGWGWMYWTWDTESATQWSYKKGMAAGILPAKAYDRDFSCSDTVPDFSDQSLPETY